LDGSGECDEATGGVRGRSSSRPCSIICPHRSHPFLLSHMEAGHVPCMTGLASSEMACCPATLLKHVSHTRLGRPPTPITPYPPSTFHGRYGTPHRHTRMPLGDVVCFTNHKIHTAAARINTDIRNCHESLHQQPGLHQVAQHTDPSALHPCLVSATLPPCRVVVVRPSAVSIGWQGWRRVSPRHSETGPGMPSSPGTTHGPPPTPSRSPNGLSSTS
jgi:hypothetical protein